jgi:hypothetical protein
LRLNGHHPISIDTSATADFLDALRTAQVADRTRSGMGRIVVHLHGAAKNTSHRASISDYSARLRGEGVRVIEHSDRTTAQGYLEEVLRGAKNRSVLLLQESGEMHDSETFAATFGRWRLSQEETHLAMLERTTRRYLWAP